MNKQMYTSSHTAFSSIVLFNPSPMPYIQIGRAINNSNRYLTNSMRATRAGTMYKSLNCGFGTCSVGVKSFQV